MNATRMDRALSALRDSHAWLSIVYNRAVRSEGSPVQWGEIPRTLKVIEDVLNERDEVLTGDGQPICVGSTLYTRGQRACSNGGVVKVRVTMVGRDVVRATGEIPYGEDVPYLPECCYVSRAAAEAPPRLRGRDTARTSPRKAPQHDDPEA